MYYQLKKDEGVSALLRYTGGLNADALASGMKVLRTEDEKQVQEMPHPQPQRVTAVNRQRGLGDARIARDVLRKPRTVVQALADRDSQHQNDEGNGQYPEYVDPALADADTRNLGPLRRQPRGRINTVARFADACFERILRLRILAKVGHVVLRSRFATKAPLRASSRLSCLGTFFSVRQRTDWSIPDSDCKALALLTSSMRCRASTAASAPASRLSRPWSPGQRPARWRLRRCRASTFHLPPLPQSRCFAGTGAFGGVRKFTAFLASSAYPACVISYFFNSNTVLRSVPSLADASRAATKRTRLRYKAMSLMQLIL